MAEQKSGFSEEEPVPMDLEPVEPEPVEAELVPVDPEDVGKDGDEEEQEESISLVETDDEEDGMSKIQAMGRRSALDQDEHDYKRSMNTDGTGATRCKLFHSRIAQAPLDHMERSINEWLDGEGEVEVKHVGHLVGIMEGKSPEPNVFVMVWY